MSLKSLFNTMPQTGTVQWIGIRPEKRANLQIVDAVVADTEIGLEGDHYGGSSGKRQVTLIQQEHLDAVASIMGLASIKPGIIRRNIVVSGINLLALKERRFQIGEATLEMTGLCHPCSRMEANLGPGGYNAMRGHGGITARVIQSGKIRTGDKVNLLPKVP